MKKHEEGTIARARPEKRSRRGLFVASALGAAALFTAENGKAATSLFVFAINDRRARAVEKDLSDALGGVSVTVFGRIADFVDGVQRSAPDAVLAPELVLQQLGVTPSLRGTLGGDTSEQYALLSEKSRAPQSAQSIGAVDLLGRRGMPGLVQRLLSTSSTPKVIRVAKVEDLLPALTFNKAEAVILPARLVPSLKARTSMSLSVVHPEHARLGCLCAGGKNVSSVASALRKIPRATLAHLGVDGWR